MSFCLEKSKGRDRENPVNFLTKMSETDDRLMD